MATPADIAAIARSMALAFHDDPVMEHILRDPRRRPQQIAALFTLEAKRALQHGALHTTPGNPGAAIWMAPNEWRMGGLETLKMYPMLRTWRTAIVRGLSVLGRVEKVHPKEPHWYLAALGTAPDRQGKGEGSAALAPILQRCDDEGLPAYLESSKESNIPFYRRHGFEVTGEVRVPDGPVFYPMWREPRSA